MVSSKPISAEAGKIEKLEERIRLLEAVINNFPGGIVLTDRNLDVVLCNAQQRALLEYPSTLFQNGNPSLRELFHFNAARGEYGPGRIEEQVGAKMEQVEKRVAHVFERVRPNGTVLEVRGAPLPEGGFVTTYLDVTEQRQNQAMIAYLAHHDALTDLPNRFLLRERLNQSLARTRRGDHFALHYIDLDRFKPVNDRHGHEAGNRLLTEVAQRLRTATREVDTVARFGGDEFVVLQERVSSLADAATLASRIVDTISRPFDSGEHRFEIGASIGVALAPCDASDINDLLRRADEAMYAKSGGGSGYRFHRSQ